MGDMNQEGRLPLNPTPQNPNIMLNPPMGEVPQNPPLNLANGLGGDHMEGRSIHGDMGAPQFRTFRDYMNPPRQVPSSCIVFPLHYATLNIRPGMMQMLPQFHGLESERPYAFIKEFEDACSLELLTSCPYHGYAEWHVINIFYAALTPQLKQFVETMWISNLMKQPHEAYSYFDYLTNLTCNWATIGTQNPESRLNTQGVKYQLKDVDDVNARLATMARKLEALEFNKVNSVGSEEPKEVCCVVCETKEHDTMSCPVIPDIKEALHGQGSGRGDDEKEEKIESVPKSEGTLREEREILAHAPFPYRKLNVRENAFRVKDVQFVVQVKTPPKYKDLGCPIITCIIGDHKIAGCLLDLGSSVNLLPYSVYEQLGLGELKPTRITLQLANRSIKDPRGIVEDVLVKVDKFYYPTDFVVLDTHPVVDPNAQNHIPIILGRPFLATCDAIVHVRGSILKLSFGNMAVELNMFHASRQLEDFEDVREVNLMDSIVQKHFERQNIEDPLARMLIFSEGLDCLEIEEGRDVLLEDNGLETCTVMAAGQWTPTFEPLIPNPIKPQPSELEAPTPERKLLPSTLKYVFLDHLSHLPFEHPVEDDSPICETFPDEQLMSCNAMNQASTPWNADVANYLATKAIPSNWSSMDKK
ncbi:hypothetical protein Acr_18g0006300 [Actinidia rufa]|uniref:Retrotransposon gag domain-containing protein n=1 Tax=Actinidia rufa TaxID=165716 RepID=A0A7J0G6P3_9ERIC|nr:hypothetical protein Acr_18g0006300 [Actinidia rufa]